jgi:hypothetical protein
MLRKAMVGAAAGVALLPQLAYGGVDIPAPMRRTAAAYATNPAERCPNIDGSQYWFLEWPPNCVPPSTEQWRR